MCLWLEIFVTVLWRNNKNAKFSVQVKLRASLYHGGDTLCAIVNSKDTMLSGGHAKWEELLTFDLPLQNVPRMARLCFMLYMLSDKRTGKKPSTARKLLDKKKVRYSQQNFSILF